VDHEKKTRQFPIEGHPTKYVTSLFKTGKVKKNKESLKSFTAKRSPKELKLNVVWQSICGWKLETKEGYEVRAKDT
jgi:hypothetical protein